MIDRTLNVSELLKKKSHFLFGPRGTGKSSIIEQQLGDSVKYITLLSSDYYLPLSARPASLGELILDERPVVIDEIQKIPALLDEVHNLIEKRKIRFLLTGSSARKLRSGGVNLLGGRAWTANLFPLTTFEIPNFDLIRYLNFGGLPAVYLSNYPSEELKAYTQSYLTEEIAAEGLVRDLPRFSRFLQRAALTNGMILNFSEIASDLGVSPTTIREYYRILEDTLVGFMLEPLRSPSSRKEVSTAKFFFFDVGVANSLRSVKSIDENTEYFGLIFEHFIAQELRAALSYFDLSEKLNFWRTHTQEEVDFVIGENLAVEVKATVSAQPRMIKGLKALRLTRTIKNSYLVSRDKVEREVEGIHFLHYKTFLERLWKRELL
jgi:predicted AAA+ superfamily ATPase